MSSFRLYVVVFSCMAC